MKKIIRLTESDLGRIVRRVIKEDEDNQPDYIKVYHMYKNGEVSKKEFYGYMGILEKHERQALIDYIESQKKGEQMESYMVSENINEEETANSTASFRLFNCLTKNFTNKFVKDEDSALTDGRTSYERIVKLGNDAKGTEYTQIINAYKKGNQTFIGLNNYVKDVPTKTPGVKQNKYTIMKDVVWSTDEKPLMDCNQLKNLILKNSPVLLVPPKYFM